ncbi:hypothetical protein ACFYNO_16040 [Kitasatospora sp. NPDC006697]|uniref:hypothetical protein n=1 Tax=Kitasatospora sp. NPDC006697 TaxID=3364020 RepID=UPI0036CF5C2A
MAGEQSGGRPADGGSAGGEGPALTGGLSGAEWWRTDGPWQEEPAEPFDGSVYTPAPEAHPTPVPQVPAVPPKPRHPPDRPAQPPAPAVDWSAGRSPAAAAFPGWDSVVIDFDPEDDSEEVGDPLVKRRPRALPEQRAAEAEADEEEVPAEEAVERPGFLTGRRPSPLLLLAAAVLVGGAISGLVLVLLIGWALAYLSKALSDLTKKFAVFGIPLVTMTLSSLWVWGRAQDRWGTPLAKGGTAGHALLIAAPGVLRIAGALTALFITVVAMRRRRQPVE